MLIKKIRILAIVAITLISFNSFSGVEEVYENCTIPENLNQYSRGMMDVYLRGEMLNTAFIRGFLTPSSGLYDLAVCIVCNFGKENDPDWERNLNICEDE